MRIFLVMSVFIISCGTKVQSVDPIPTHDTFKVESKEVGEVRVINVWKPPMYKNSEESFPVLYMPDGGIKEDFPHMANTLAKLIKEKRIQPIILVGIENTERGRDLTGYSESDYDARFCPQSDGAKSFRSFIMKELIPIINNRYKTSTTKGIIGESLAGLFVMETLMQYPESFDFYIAFDPSLWWNNHYLLRNANELFKKFPDKEIKLWFAGSDTEDISKYTKELNKYLENNAPGTLKWKYSNEEKEKHNTIFRATKEKALTWMLNQ